MKIRISDVSEEVRHLEYHESVELMNEAIERAGVHGDQRFAERLLVEVELYRFDSDVHVSGQVAGRLVCICVRCLDEFSSPLRRRFRYLLVSADGNPSLEADTGLDRYDGDEIELGVLVREQALLALEPLSLCREDCRGLCPECGANLNHEPCRC